MAKEKFYVTTPIYYVTARPHLGSLYSTLLADVATRWNKLQGKKTFFLTGTDEYGQKVAEQAQKAGKSPQDFVDSFIPAYKELWADYGIVYNHFIRTTDEHHVKAVQQWITMLIQKGDIYKAFYEGWYCTHCETFVTEKEFDPQGVYTKDNGPACPSCTRPTKAVSEETYFFKLSAYQDKLLKFYEENPNFVVPKERLNEVINFVKGGLKDLSISRTTISWGIPFPGDAKHVTYVWADALNNYITAIGYGNNDKQQEFNQWWPADVHILGKDIIRFHAIFWPAFLMASGLALPKQLLVHGWITVNHQKMSKSLGNVVDPQALMKLYGADPIRYYLVRQMAINQDGDFSIADLEQRITADLANDLGNLLNRMTSLAEKFDAAVIKPPVIWSEPALKLREECWDMLEEFHEYMDGYLFHMALTSLWKFIGQVNAYFHAQEPWKLAKQHPEQFNEVLSATCHGLRAIGVLLWPVMPTKMEALLNSLGASHVFENNTIENLELSIWKQEFKLIKIPTLFEKPEEKKQETMETQNQSVIPLDEISIEDVVKVKLVVGTIESCEELPKSDKLYKLSVNFGDKGVRTILSGIRKFFAPADLIGKQAVFVFNLKPRPMMGFESHGMLLITTDKDGNRRFVAPVGVVLNGAELQ